MIFRVGDIVHDKRTGEVLRFVDDDLVRIAWDDGLERTHTLSETRDTLEVVHAAVDDQGGPVTDVHAEGTPPAENPDPFGGEEPSPISDAVPPSD